MLRHACVSHIRTQLAALLPKLCAAIAYSFLSKFVCAVTAESGLCCVGVQSVLYVKICSNSYFFTVNKKKGKMSVEHSTRLFFHQGGAEGQNIADRRHWW